MTRGLGGVSFDAAVEDRMGSDICVLGVMPERYLDSLFEAAYAVDRSRRIVYWNPSAEELTGFSAAEVLGSGCADGILVHVDERGGPLCSGTCPACEAMEKGAVREVEVFLRHRAGHRVKVRVRSVPVVQGGVASGVIEFFEEVGDRAAIRRRMEQLERLAMLDPLTGLGNRRHANAVLAASRSALARYGWAFGVVMLDIDGFKGINDRLGHEAGDRVLQIAARSMLATLRPSDHLFRWGGDEFLAVLPGVSGADLASACDRLLSMVGSSAARFEGGPAGLSVSAGATIAAPGERSRAIVARADTLLYESKRSGKNTYRIG